MSRIVIDARESGTSTGRYIDKLIENLGLLKPAQEITVLAKPHRVDYLQELAPDFTVVETRYKEFTFAEQLGFRKQLDALRADLVHFGMVQQPILYKKRTVTTIHDLTTLRFNNPDKLLGVFKIKQQVYQHVIKRVAMKSSALIVPSQFVKNDVIKFTGVDPAKITVTHEAADRISQPAGAIAVLEKLPFIMYVGRPTPHKNLERLIQAFQILQKQQPDLKLALVGQQDGNYRRVEAFAAKRGVRNIVFTGFASEGQLRWLYENCRAYVFPSLSEGFGLPGLEAMMHGAPVVSSNATCLPEIYGDTAEYFDPLNVQGMADAIQKVLTDQNLRAELIKKGAAQAKKYAWKRMAQQTLEIYEKALKS
jgi:glycosyltransferase involved in cell wall biosynthesis